MERGWDCWVFEGGGRHTDIQALTEAARELFGICVAVAAMEMWTGTGSAAKSFRSLCALAATLCALRMAVRLF